MRQKPKKPYATYPLYAHASGMWAKKILGKTHYFGPWSDPQGAVEKYLKVRDYLRAGLDPPECEEPEEIEDEQGETVGQLLDEFLDEKKSLLDTEDITSITYKEYEATCEVIRRHLGARTIDSLQKSDFTSLRVALSKRQPKKRKGRKSQKKLTPLSVASLKRRLTIARMIFVDHRSIWRSALKSPNKRLLRAKTQERGKLLYKAEEIRTLVRSADPHLAAMILLGINCGFGPLDCCTVPTEAIDFQGGWHDYGRPKTGVERRAALWPETIEVLKKVADKKLVINGRKWTRHIVAREFVKLCDSSKVRNIGFYSLRRTFETIASTAAVPQAIVDHIMGHANADMASVYRQQVFDQHLTACSEHVRQWFLGNLTLA